MHKKAPYIIIAFLLATAPPFAQSKRLRVLQPTGEMVEYDLTTFAPKQHIKLPTEAAKSPATISINRAGQILFAPAVSLPLSESDIANPHKIWIWNGHSALSIDQPLEHKEEAHGSNQAISESAPIPYLVADGTHLFWFANEARRLEREGVDLSTTNSFQAWQTDLEGKGREEVASSKLPDCRCPTGSCEESSPTFMVWAPDAGVDTRSPFWFRPGVDNFFLTTQFAAEQTSTTYKASTRYQQEGGKWNPTALTDPLQRVLDANSNGTAIVVAIPDTGCCGWSNESNDQTLLIAEGKT